MASASVVLTSDTSGSVTVTVPSGTALGTTTLTLPTSGGTIQTSGSGYTTNGVAYASSTSALTTGSGLTFDGSNLGLGVTPSSWNASVFRAFEGNSYASCIAFQTGGPSMKIGTNWYYNNSGNYVYKTTNAVSRMDYNDGYFSWYNAPSGTAGGTISFTQAMTLDSNGNLLVGTTSAQGKATINGYVTAGPSSFINANYHQFNQNLSADLVRFTNSNASPYGFEIAFSGAAPNNTTNFFLAASDNTGVKLYIWSNGNLQNSNNSYGGISDVKLKENIVDATPKLDDLLKVKVRSYNFINDESKTKQLGVVAQELETIFPSMIEETPDKDAEGNELGTTTKGVKYSVFVPMLIKSIQELSTLITAQSATIQSLTERITALEGART